MTMQRITADGLGSRSLCRVEGVAFKRFSKGDFNGIKWAPRLKIEKCAKAPPSLPPGRKITLYLKRNCLFFL